MEALLGPVFSRLTGSVTPEHRFQDPVLSSSPMPAHLVARVDIPPYTLVYNAEPCDGKWVGWEFDAHEVRLDQQRKYWTLTGDNAWVADGNFEWPEPWRPPQSPRAAACGAVQGPSTKGGGGV